MAVFSYQARDERGDLVAGTITADSATLASRALRAEGKYVLDLTPGVRRVDDRKFETMRATEAARRVRREEIIDFCHQISVMLETGVPLSAALESYNRHARASDFQRITQAVADDVTGGDSLSAALSRWPRAFPSLVIGLIQASEASGTMGLMLDRISRYLAKEHKTARQIKGALTYPCVMMMLAMAVTVFLMTVVLPRFASIYASRAAKLPAPTRIMIAISEFWANHWMTLCGTSVTVLVAVFLFSKRRAGRKVIDWLRLHAPVVGPLFSKLYLTRASRTMATMLVSGVDLLETIKITSGVTGNFYYQSLWEDAISELEQGKQLSEALEKTSLIPGNVVQMIVAGEKSGRLGQVMERIAEVSEVELDEAVARSTRMIEPLMIGIMGVVIGFVAVALLLPIMTISNVMH